MGGGEQENQPVRSQSARPKKQERLKKKPWNAKPKPARRNLQMPRTPTPPDPGHCGDMALPAPPRALLPPRSAHPAPGRNLWPADSPEGQVRSARGRRITEEWRDALGRLHKDRGTSDVLAVLKKSIKIKLCLRKLEVLVGTYVSL